MANFSQHDTVINFYEGVPITAGLQVAFQNEEQQAAWWSQYRSQQHTSVAYIRYKTGHVDIEGQPRDLLKCNYLSFINVSLDDQPFYGKITSVNMINRYTVRVEFEIDYWQSFMHDAEYRASQIDREHLTQADHDRAVANPNVQDIPELYTEEDLPVKSELEVLYKWSDKLAVRTNGQAAWGAITPIGAGVTPIIQSVGSYDGLTSIIGQGGGYDEPYNPMLLPARNTTLILQVAKYEGITQMLDEVFHIRIEDDDISHIDGGYSDGFARGYLLLSLGGSVPSAKSLMTVNRILETSGGTDQGNVLNEYFTRFMDYMAGNNITHQILGIWMVPTDVRERDIGARALDEFLAGPQYHAHYVSSYGDIEGYGVTVRNPKLERAPFRYIRATSPSGATKDYYIEKFNHNVPTAEDADTPVFMYYGNFDDVPSLSIAPLGYKGQSIAFDERLTYNSFPQVGYNIDGFLSHISAVQQNAVLGETSYQLEARESINNRRSAWDNVGANPVGTLFYNQDDLAGAFSAFKQQLGGIAKEETDHYQSEAQRGWQTRMAQRVDGMNADDFSAIRSGDSPDKDFGHQRQALIGAGQYVAGNAEGSMLLRLGQAVFRLQTVTLMPEIVKKYDDFFEIYGYKSGRIGIPRIASWTKGGVQPRFVNFDGLRFTYVKTTNMKVHSIFEPAAEYIQQLFDRGCRFIDGSRLDA